MTRFRIGNDLQLKVAAMLGAGALAVSQSDRDLADPKLWALAMAAGAAALVTLLRPPGSPSTSQVSLPPAAPKTPPALRRRGRVTTPPPTPLTEPVVSTPAPPKRAAGQIPEVIGRG